MKNRRSEQEHKLSQLRASGKTDTQILEWVLGNFMSADDACDAMDSLLEELEECPSCGSVNIYQCNDCENRRFDS